MKNWVINKCLTKLKRFILQNNNKENSVTLVSCTKYTVKKLNTSKRNIRTCTKKNLQHDIFIYKRLITHIPRFKQVI